MAWGTPRAPQCKPPPDTLTLSPQGPAGLEGLDGKDGKPGQRVRLQDPLGFYGGVSHPSSPKTPTTPVSFLPG